jgi:hypothetical protein
VFGGTLAAGDVDGDGDDDLAVGVPGETMGGVRRAGVVALVLGSFDGLTAAGNRVVSQDTPGVPGRAEVNDRFGWELVLADLDGDGDDDLAVGVGHEALPGGPEGGAVQVLNGGEGFGVAGGRILHQGLAAIPGELDRDDHFGVELAAGDLDGDGRSELLIGTPHEQGEGLATRGTITVVSSPLRRNLLPATLLTDPLPPGWGFGHSVAVGDLDSDGFGDVIVGVPEVDAGAGVRGGRLEVFSGSANGVDGAVDRTWETGPLHADEGFDGPIASGDVDGDGFDDVVVGQPDRILANPQRYGGGLVLELHGSPALLDAGLAATWERGRSGLDGPAAELDWFGAALGG